MKTVLVIDDDVGFLFWLGNTLESAAYNVVPSTTIPDARVLLARLGFTIDLLIINPALVGASEFIDALRRDHPGLGVVAAIEKGDTANLTSARDRVAEKPTGLMRGQNAIAYQTLETEAEESLMALRAEWLLIIRTALDGRATSAD